MFTVKYKVKKVVERNEHGILEKKFVPICKKALFGIGFWKECPDWKPIEKRMSDEKYLGLDSDSTLTHIRAFIDENVPVAPTNEYYNE